ncbi:MAG: hypothetical protein PHT78_11955 [Desulfitobacteriaceae bacterium]|nr:hypothetical protein [Desulfitobacteriaceae bacterium]
MTKFNKLYAKIARNPKDVDFNELDKVLKQYGFKCGQPGKGSSHYVYYHQKLPDTLSIPRARPVKAIYVRFALNMIEGLKEGEEK